MILFLTALLAPVLTHGTVSAVGHFSASKITMSSQASGSVSTDANGTAVAAGTGGNGAKARHTFNFTLGTSGATIGSVLLQYCTTPLMGTTCTAPTGMDASTVASIQSISGFASTAPALDTTTTANTGGYFSQIPCSGSGTYRTNCILLKRTSGTAESGTPAFTLGFGTGGGTDWIKNPTATGTFYVRIVAFSDTAYTTLVDEAAVAGSVNNYIDITASVQERLNFSTSTNYSAPGAGCSALGAGSTLALGDSNGFLNVSTAYAATSYFRASTNASGGIAIYYAGDTLKTPGGAASIAAIGATEALSTPGTAQFGIGLNSGDGNQSLTNLTADTDYDEANGNINPTVAAKFAFTTASLTTPERIAYANAGTSVACDTGSVRYLGNISNTTRAGIYTTTINYIATGTF
jgi:hypothetical protein